MDQYRPTTTGIIINFNGGDLVLQAIDSILHQTATVSNIIVVDNASTDGSLRVIREKFGNAITLVVNTTNTGFAHAVNQAIKHSTGSHIILLNNDAWIEHNFVEDALRQLKSSSAQLLAPAMKDYEGKHILSWGGNGIDIFGHFVSLNRDQKPFYLGGCCIFFTRAMYIETGGLDDDFFLYFEEVDWFWRLHLLNVPFQLATDLFVMHRYSHGTGKGLSCNRFLWRNQNCLQMLLKNYSFYTLVLILPLYITTNIVEMIVFTIIGKPQIALTYLQGFVFNFKLLPRTIGKRTLIQSHRKVSDIVIMSRMYKGSAKLRHLLGWFRTKTPSLN